MGFYREGFDPCSLFESLICMLYMNLFLLRTLKHDTFYYKKWKNYKHEPFEEYKKAKILENKM
ncbi:hypothetical protein CN925_01745 [Bacillus sp. AFS055030]|nr:hypothetical protein CN925_01745 [Bacillus sp. AFS055030]